MNVLLIRLYILLHTLSLAFNTLAQNLGHRAIVLSELKRLHIPGLAAAKLQAGKMAWVNYYGYQNIDQQIPISEQTIFHLASLSSTVTAAAVMQLVGQGACSLDEDINRYLPFAVRTPFHPQRPITLRQLLRHRSSLHDNLEYPLPFWEGRYKGAKPPLETFLKNYLAVGGSTYQKEKNFSQAASGERFDYSNMGCALLGYVVETLSKMSFDAYCQTNLFAHLGLQRTHWFLEPIDPRKLAVPCLFSDSLKCYQPQPHST